MTGLGSKLPSTPPTSAATALAVRGLEGGGAALWVLAVICPYTRTCDDPLQERHGRITRWDAGSGRIMLFPMPQKSHPLRQVARHRLCTWLWRAALWPVACIARVTGEKWQRSGLRSLNGLPDTHSRPRANKRLPSRRISWTVDSLIGLSRMGRRRENVPRALSPWLGFCRIRSRRDRCSQKRISRLA
jgi:hypothetical protein